MDSSKELNTKGIGLGLFITKKIVQVYGGQIMCFSDNGRGSQFVLIVPLGTRLTNQNLQSRIKSPIQKVFPKIFIDSD